MGRIPLELLVSEFHSSICASFFLLSNFFGKEVEAQRTGRLIKIDILALMLIALNKQFVFLFKAEGGSIF